MVRVCVSFDVFLKILSHIKLMDRKGRHLSLLFNPIFPFIAAAPAGAASRLPPIPQVVSSLLSAGLRLTNGRVVNV